MCERLRHERLPNHHHRQEEPTVARPILAAFVVIDPLMERRGHRTPPEPPRARGGGWGGAGPRLRDPDDCRRRRYVCWPSSRTGVADDARVRLSVGADRRRALQSSPPSARRWDGLNSGRVGGDVHDGRRGHHREPPPPPPVCRRVRARRGRKAPGRACCGSCAAKREKVVGWHVHLVRRLQHALTRVQMLPAGMHDLTPPPNWWGAYGLPAGARRLGVAAVRAKRVRANNYSPLLRPYPLRPYPLRRRRRRRASRRRRGRRTLDGRRPCRV